MWDTLVCRYSYFLNSFVHLVEEAVEGRSGEGKVHQARQQDAAPEHSAAARGRRLPHQVRHEMRITGS